MTRHTFSRSIAMLAGCAGLVVAAGLAQAQSAYPVKPVRVVVPFPAGGTSDILARLIGAKLHESWGQQLVVDNRPGANGNIGAEITARAVPDGHTLILMDVGALAISPSLFPKLPFDIVRDFAAVTTISYSPHLFASHPSVPVRSVRELVALAKAQPGKLNYPAGLGGAPHLAGLLFAQRTGVKWEYIPTKGGAQSVQAAAAGEGDVLFMGMLQMLPHVKSGRLRLLAVSSEKREPSLPDTPTVAETRGLEGFVTGSWQGLLAPARTPAEIVARINADVSRVLAMPDIREKLLSQGTSPLTMSPQETTRWLVSEKERWAKLIRETGFRLQD